jgi:hypothetical protein
MESPFSGETEVPHGEAPISPSISSRSHYIIASEEIIANRDSPLGLRKRNGGVFKGFWNNSLVAIRYLSNETPLDVSGQGTQLENPSTHRRTSDRQVAGTHPHVAGIEASTCVAGLWCFHIRCGSTLHRLAILS